jgi:hypothetical protein
MFYITASLSKFKYSQLYSKAAAISKGKSKGPNGLFWRVLLCTCHHPYVTSGCTACQREIKTVQLRILQECFTHSFVYEIKWTAKEENVEEANRYGRWCNVMLLTESQWTWISLSLVIQLLLNTYILYWTSGVRILLGAWHFLVSKTSRLALGPTQPSDQCIPRFIPVGKRPGREVNRIPPHSAEIKNGWS